jgi:RNA polymerase sigma-70 factor (ECF subfamily)
MSSRPVDASVGAAEQGAIAAPGDEVDRQLVRRVLGGEREAFRELVQRHQARVFHLARSLLRNPADAADIAQEAFVRAYGSLGRYRAEGSFTAWIAKITNNLAIDFLRRQKIQASTELDENLTDSDASHAGILASQVPADPQASTLRHELGRELERALGRLPEKHRSILILREIDGLTYQELSETLAVPVGTVMSRLFHARAKMQEMLREYLESPSEDAAAKPIVKDRE